ncbi:SlyX family protein [Roseateles koreensis]|uniref:SlyX family protein n=1 Tax=Roseateles koreensis TaxID=2987526 RepID=A0ABT5KW56_9BURK|nr:SlyX family protein [Roseateles koreensis]MDC8787168.1 SlyX family protein [Roseateles koreensis]
MELSHPIDPQLEARLTALEIKASFNEDLLDELNEIVVRQQQQIDLLRNELLALREQRSDDGTPAFRSLRDELPPHY